MKLCSSMVLLLTFQPSANAISQQNKLNIQVEKVNIREIIKQIKSQSNYTFVYNVEELDRIGKITLTAKDSDIDEVMSTCLRNTGFTYRIHENVVIIKRQEIDDKNENTPKIRGSVVDKKGIPLPGVTVLVKGSKIGVSTNKDGLFELIQPKDSSVILCFSFIGMKNQEIKFKGQSFLKVILEENTQEIDEIVITGYQIIDRKKLTGAVTSVNMSDIIIPGTMSLDQMLEGQIPDMMLTTNSGEVGVVPRIRVRGTSTLIGNREPLWVVDGFVVSDPVPISADELNDPDYINRIGNSIAGLNPQDIERVDVLKDAAATALYGAKAANGVIVITTKKGHIGKPIVSYNMTTTFKRRPRYSDPKIDVMNSKERIEFSKELAASHYPYSSINNTIGYEGLLNQLYNKEINDDTFAREVRRLETENTDWFDLLMKDVISHQHTVSISGGSDVVRYYSSVGYAIDNDVIRGNDNERYTVALKLDANFTNFISTSFGINGNVSSRNYNQDEITPMDYAYNTSRAIPAYNEDGTLSYYKKENGTTYYNYNILNELKNSGHVQNGSGISFNANLNLKFTDYLNGTAQISYSTSTTEIEKYWGEKTWHSANLKGCENTEEPPVNSLLPYGGELSKNHTRNNSYTIRLQLNLNKYFGMDNKHNVNANVGYEVSSSKYNGYDNTTRGYFPERGKQFSPGIDLGKFTAYRNWISGNVPIVTDNLTNLLSGYITAAYSYKNLATISANARFDGSNSFGNQSNKKLLPVWSVSGSFNLSELKSLKTDWMDYMILKASYGYQGNMLKDQSPVMIIKQGPTDPYYNELTSTVARYPNPNLKWERTQSFNSGLEFSLFSNRLRMEASYYFKHTKDAFLRKPVNSINGVTEYVINSGNISNSGFSVALSAVPVRTGDFLWRISTSYSKTYNTMKTLPGADQYELDNFLAGTALVKGKAIGTFYSYKFRGLNPADGGPLFDDMEDRQEVLKGATKYDTYTTVLTPSGQREPTMSGNITNTVKYKNWLLNVMLAYSLGSKIRLFHVYTGSSAIESGNTINPENNVNRDFLKRWKKSGDERYTDIPAILNPGTDAYVRYAKHYSTMNSNIPNIANNAWKMYDYGDQRVVSGNYLTCRNLSLTYEFSNELVNKIYMSRLAISFSTTNLFSICSSKLKGQTPTQNGFTSIQLSERPTYSLGLNISF